MGNTMGLIIYQLQHSVGITPKWEQQLVMGDTKLQSYKRWMKSDKVCSQSCKELYDMRISYLKGWMNG